MCHEMYWRRSAAKEDRKSEPRKVEEAPREVKAKERTEKVPELA